LLSKADAGMFITELFACLIFLLPLIELSWLYYCPAPGPLTNMLLFHVLLLLLGLTAVEYDVS
jgi:hypothetical protein